MLESMDLSAAMNQIGSVLSGQRPLTFLDLLGAAGGLGAAYFGYKGVKKAGTAAKTATSSAFGAVSGKTPVLTVLIGLVLMAYSFCNSGLSEAERKLQFSQQVAKEAVEHASTTGPVLQAVRGVVNKLPEVATMTKTTHEQINSQTQGLVEKTVRTMDSQLTAELARAIERVIETGPAANDVMTTAKVRAPLFVIGAVLTVIGLGRVTGLNHYVTRDRLEAAKVLTEKETEVALSRLDLERRYDEKLHQLQAQSAMQTAEALRRRADALTGQNVSHKA